MHEIPRFEQRRHVGTAKSHRRFAFAQAEQDFWRGIPRFCIAAMAVCFWFYFANLSGLSDCIKCSCREALLGGAVARHLRKANATVHALVRHGTNANALIENGIRVFRGSYDDVDSLKAALNGVTTAFLNFSPSFSDFEEELRHAKTLVSAAREARVQHIVYSSSFGLEEDELSRPGLDPNGIVAKIYQIKRDVTREMTTYPSYTILRPAKFLSDLIGPAARWFGDLTTTGVFETALPKV
ncbi:unnamed protein product [Parascedosporium putredinis]|uniref:NmrA-like domain-containing protein n=1 Tax=Parascedosporium putredinis TaxID=1442378 RepID=A0A9P1GVY9_9PEZI|nr:unnamed protein product [Parascedosporium putredinis]CAI7988358.1 unnamed protein product [Parascedosporium putredinis]